MSKYLVLLLMIFGLTACDNKNENYYLSHLPELQKAIKSCPNQTPPQLSCEQVDAIGRRINVLAYQLQMSPQGFGSKILALQQTIAQQELELKKGKNEELSASLKQNKHDLTDYLAVVKWLESPES